MKYSYFGSARSVLLIVGVFWMTSLLLLASSTVAAQPYTQAPVSQPCHAIIPSDEPTFSHSPGLPDRLTLSQTNVSGNETSCRQTGALTEKPARERRATPINEVCKPIFVFSRGYLFCKAYAYACSAWGARMFQEKRDTEVRAFSPISLRS